MSNMTVPTSARGVHCLKYFCGRCSHEMFSIEVHIPRVPLMMHEVQQRRPVSEPRQGTDKREPAPKGNTVKIFKLAHVTVIHGKHKSKQMYNCIKQLYEMHNLH